MTVWSTGVIPGSQTDCFTQLHLPHPKELGMLLTTPYVVCGTGCVGAVVRAPGGHTRSLSKQIFALIKVALEMKYGAWFYNFHMGTFDWPSQNIQEKTINYNWLLRGCNRSTVYKSPPLRGEKWHGVRQSENHITRNIPRSKQTQLPYCFYSITLHKSLSS